MIEFDMHQCGQRVKALRKAKHLRQRELAAAAALRSPHLISYIECGSKSTLQAETIVRLAQALNTTTDYLLGLTNEPPALPSLSSSGCSHP